MFICIHMVFIVERKIGGGDRTIGSQEWNKNYLELDLKKIGE